MEIKGWISRDKDNGLTLYTGTKPIREHNQFWDNSGNPGSYRMSIDENLFPELTWESEPIEVELTIKPI
jgi:hypothetical protein